MPKHIIGIGEILWDVFPDGARFGGAPANFACSVAELAPQSAEAHMVSAVGDDPLGRDALAALQARGVRTDAVQVKPESTGRVLVELDDQGVASYRFEENSAWDRVTWTDQLQGLASACHAVCFGTLGQRGETSRETIRRFIETTPATALRILDVNLRSPHYNDELILESLRLANVLKLNEDELPLVARLSDCTGDETAAMEKLAAKYGFHHVALTRGASGAAIVSKGSISDLPGVSAEVVDTVGAGDAFTAAMALDLLAGEPLDVVNRNAMAVAAHVCSHAGATMSFPEHLRRD